MVKIKEKKGFLLGEYTLKIILAVLCLVLLVFLLFSLYSMFAEKKDLEKAKESLEEIKSALELAEKTGKSEVMIKGPEGILRNWWIASFTSNPNVKRGSEDYGFSELPEQCDKDIGSCICICKGKIKNTFEYLITWRLNNFCNELGACIDYKNVRVLDNMQKQNIIYIYNGLFLDITKTENFLQIKEER